MRRLLIVDDDSSFVTNCTYALRHRGYAVAEAGEVASALVSLQRQTPDAMMLDWKLPDGTGLEILRWLDERRYRFPVVMVTGFWSDTGYEDAIKEAASLGITYWLRRGIDIDDPVDVVDRLFDEFPAADSAVDQHDRHQRDVLAVQLLASVVPRLRAAFRGVARETIIDAVVDAIDHLEHPERFDSSRGIPLSKFTFVAARRNLLNRLQSEARHRARFLPAHESADVSQPVSAPAPHDIDIVTVALSREPDPSIRAALRKWLDGDTSLNPWSDLARFRGVLEYQMRQEVKRLKDAFVARCKRAVRRNSHG
jgi:ActR/RegA family two-component response regulator/DNA-directed RNA polymerase specialized sigma24 family protein